uniref:ARAD1C44066p n=1 Tax=Blastobotrys adeninivorans TaxID=409370 RepID=A0A060T4T9_BLAAD
MGQQHHGLSTARVAAIIVAMNFGVFIGALDGTVVTSLLSHIASELHELSRVGWIATGYLVACAAFQPLYGKISDIFGRQQVLLFCNFMFALGLVICGYSYDLETLVLGRVVSGIGGGGIMSLSTIVLSDLIPLRHRGIFQGIGNLCFGAGAGLGGIFGGVISDRYGWRKVFSLQVPAVVISMILLLVCFRNPAKKDQQEPLLSDDSSETYGATDASSKAPAQSNAAKIARIDFYGCGCLVATLVCLMFGISTGGNQFPWLSYPVVGSLVASLVFAAAFTYVELRIAKEPVIALHLFKEQTILASSLTNLFGTMAAYSILFFAPVYYSSVLNMTATEVGQRLAANFLGVAIGSFGSGVYMARTGRYYWIGVISGGLMIGAAWILLWITPEKPEILQYLALNITGLGYSIMLTVTLLALISAVPFEFHAVATSIQYAFRGIGSTLGVSVASSVFHNVLASQLQRRVHGKHAEEVISRVLDSVEAIRELPAKYQAPVLQSYDVACKVVFISVAILAGVCIITSSLQREHKLHSTLTREEEEAQQTN